jgi:hypothetical protein
MSCIHGFTANFSESCEALVKGARLFYPQDFQHIENNIIKAGTFTEFFCPFEDNAIDISKAEAPMPMEGDGPPM